MEILDKIDRVVTLGVARVSAFHIRRMEGYTFHTGLKEVTFLHAPWNRIEIWK